VVSVVVARIVTLVWNRCGVWSVRTTYHDELEGKKEEEKYRQYKGTVERKFIKGNTNQK
jgi:hypothetical protein